MARASQPRSGTRPCARRSGRRAGWTSRLLPYRRPSRRRFTGPPRLDAARNRPSLSSKGIFREKERHTRLAALCLVLALSLPAAAQEEPIRQTIQDQMDALQADDFARAFSFASPNIKGIFGTPENFGAMVKNGYPMVYRPAEVEMLELREVAGNLWQRV
ncbi:MAG: DUF4864 domain-containing protein, partial [Tabrizicola sp.]|nr:DUF4864 domain-containing protein [Tabrizicola sp.]